MAEIPVAKNSGARWLWWLLAAVVAIALLIWILNAGDDTDDAVAVGEPAVERAAGVTDDPITQVAMLTGAATPMMGREVALERVTVQSVVGDRAFYIGPNANETVLVVLDEVPTPTTAIEGRYDVTPGQVINVMGVVADPATLRLDAADARAAAGMQSVVHARSLDIVEGA
jgi:hypothetical protein